ncbi:MAG TPA: hypothetical protein VGG73_06730 [Vicinamibacterales bacterium]|jgi:hypothetical protein
MMTFHRGRFRRRALGHARTALLLVPLCAAACNHTGPKTIADAPPLDVPAPPPRDVAPNDTEAPPPVSLVPEPAHNTPQLPRPAPREQPRADTPRPEPVKPEPAPSEPSKPAEEPARPTVLQTAPAQVEGEVERGIRASLVKATSELNRVDYRALNVDARTQYDTAKRFISQADEALRVKNLVFAKNFAEKAAALAAQLGSR